MWIIFRYLLLRAIIISKLTRTIQRAYRFFNVKIYKKNEKRFHPSKKANYICHFINNLNKMKKLAFTSLLLFLAIIQLSAQDDYLVNTEISSVEWIGRKVTGEHSGVIKLKNGSYTFEDGLITKGEFIINMETIEVTDIEDEESNGKLRGHLTSPDFFNVNKYPNGKLTVIKSEKIGNSKLKLMATLQLKEISKDIEFEVTMLQEGDKMVAIGQVDINRTEFDIRYGSGSFFDNLGDKAIKDNFTVKFKVAAIKK